MSLPVASAVAQSLNLHDNDVTTDVRSLLGSTRAISANPKDVKLTLLDFGVSQTQGKKPYMEDRTACYRELPVSTGEKSASFFGVYDGEDRFRLRWRE